MQRLTGKRTAISGHNQGGWHSLTKSERQIARLVSLGMSNRAVAEHLTVSPHTVNTHLRHAFAKLNVSSRVQLTRHVFLHDSTYENA